MTHIAEVSLLLLIFLSPLPVFTGYATSDSPENVLQMASDEPLSIILMIGDGMGYEHVELARLVEAGVNGTLGMQRFDWNSSALTYSMDSAITDSAAAGTAMSTGNKTNNQYIAVDATGHTLDTILEYAQTLDKSTGIVSTATVYHATPASFMTHVLDRNNYSEITRQIVEEAEVDVILGGGIAGFTSEHITTMETNGYSIVNSRTELAGITSGKTLGLFNVGYMRYEQIRPIETEPSILEMTNKAIELLSQDPDGFFLMVEGGRIDHAAHDWDTVNTASRI